MAKAHEELDEAEWLIGVLGARLDGFVEPLRPRARPAGDLLLRRRARPRDRRGRPRGHRAAARPGALLRSLRRRPRARRAPARRLRARWAGARCPGRRRRAGAAPTPGPLKDLKHLHYDGTPLFAAARAPGRRSAGRRSPSAPAACAPACCRWRRRCCRRTSSTSRSRTTSTRSRRRRPSERRSRRRTSSSRPRRSATGAFAAMEGEAPAEIETAPVAASDTQPE